MYIRGIRSLITYDISPVLDGLIVMPVFTMVQLGSMNALSKVLDMMELRCEEVEPLFSSCMNPNFTSDFARQCHDDEERSKL